MGNEIMKQKKGAADQADGKGLCSISARKMSPIYYIIAMDSSNYYDLKQLAPAGLEHKVYRFMEFAPDWENDDVPDPYYGGGNGFENVFKMVEAASEGLLAHILSSSK